MKDIKITLDASQLTVVVSALMPQEEFNFWPTNDIDILLKSLRDELSVRFRKKQIEQKPKQKFTLKAYEAVALKQLLIRQNFSGPFEQNTVLMLVQIIDKQL